MLPALKQKDSRPQLGSQVSTVIKKILPMGLAVQLSNGLEGMIRQRELFWSQNQRNTWENDFEIGQELEAIVLAEDDKYLELSLRLVNDDPWQRISTMYDVRQLVEGVVTGIEPYGAFIELAPGITGLLHHTKLPSEIPGRIGDSLWSGDKVKVNIESIDPDKRRISLSMVGQRINRWTNLLADKSLGSATSIQLDTDNSSDLQIRTLFNRSYSIVLVEDDPEQRTALAHWLQNEGNALRSTETAQDALILLHEYQSDVVISDVGLPDENIDGIGLINRLVKRYPTGKYVLMTDWLKANERSNEISALRKLGVQFLVKPLLPEDMRIVFEKIEDGTNQNDIADDDQLLDNQTVETIFENHNTESTTYNPPVVRQANSNIVSPQLNRVLRRVLREYKARMIVLFSLDSRQRVIQPITHVGTGALNPKTYHELIHSPVRDVIEDGRVVRIDDIKERKRYLNNLLPLLAFRSCVGIPVEISTSDPYGLFIFFAEPSRTEQFSDYQLTILGWTVGAHLEQHLIHQRLVEMQQMVMLGVLAKGFVHEVNHHLSPLNFGIDALEEKCEQIGNNLENDLSKAHTTMKSAGSTLGQLGASVKSLTKTARSFAELSIQDRVTLVQIDELVRRSIELVLDTTHHRNVEIHYHPPDQMLYTRVQATKLQQVIVNVVLNAVQQIHVFRPTFGGTVHVWLERASRQNETFIIINVEDDGPGIHRRQWSQIFELGFSSREGDGSGMGLYIARNLMQEMGGAIDIESSFVFWGTKIRIELPVTVA